VEAPQIITHGAQRRAFEAIWNHERYDLLGVFLASQPVVWRYFLKHRIFEAVDKIIGDRRPVAEEMSALFDEMRIRYALS
jgi:N-methylhydantoinase B